MRITSSTSPLSAYCVCAPPIDRRILCLRLCCILIRLQLHSLLYCHLARRIFLNPFSPAGFLLLLTASSVLSCPPHLHASCLARSFFILLFISSPPFPDSPRSPLLYSYFLLLRLSYIAIPFSSAFLLSASCVAFTLEANPNPDVLSPLQLSYSLLTSVDGA